MPRLVNHYPACGLHKPTKPGRARNEGKTYRMPGEFGSSECLPAHAAFIVTPTPHRLEVYQNHAPADRELHARQSHG
jgi:hypothetical protein